MKLTEPFFLKSRIKFVLDTANLLKNDASCKMKMLLREKIRDRVGKNGTKNIDITLFQATDFAEKLDTFVQKHGPLDMSMKNLSGKSMLVHMIDRVEITFETAIVLMNNPNITNVDWLATDTE